MSTKKEEQEHEQLFWYFAYGSNLCKSQMRDRVGDWKESKKALLRGWKLVFNVASARWDGGAANIEKTGNPNDAVFGAIYQITPEQLDILTSKYEKVPARKMNIESNGKTLDAQVCIFKQGKPELKPTSKYLEKIIEGLKDHGYSNDVIQTILLKASPQ